MARVQSKEDIEISIAKSKDILDRLGVQSIRLFGSFLRDEIHEDSDIDLLVDFYPGKKIFDNFMDLAFFLETSLGRKVELVTPQSLSKHLGPHILKEVEYVYPS